MEHNHTRTPGYVLAANICGITAAVLIALFVFYYVLFLAGEVKAPPVGTMSLWTTAVTLLGVIKVAQWAVDKSAARTHALIETHAQGLQRQLADVSDAALKAEHKAGRWEGVATTLREVQGDQAGDLIPFGGRRRPG